MSGPRNHRPWPPGRTVATVLLLAATLAGCRQSTSTPGEVASGGPCANPPPAERDTRVTLSVEGTERWYQRRQPARMTQGVLLPLVMDLHGYGESAQLHLQITRMAEFGARNGFVTVTPQGGGAVPAWNTALDSLDVKFLATVLDDTEAHACIDRNRVFVIGLSNGAMMASTLGCVLAGRVAAIAAVAGVADPKGCAPSRPVPVLAIHGTADQFLPYNGGLGPAVTNLPAPDRSGRTLGEVGILAGTKGSPAVPKVLSAWAAHNGCPAGSPAARHRAHDVTELRWPCPPAAEVVLERIEGGGHSWPSSQFLQAAAKIVGRTTFSIDANTEAWSFFQAHPLR